MRKLTNKVAETLRNFNKDEKGVDIIVMIVVLAILIAFAALFRTQMTGFLNRLFGDILSF